MHTREIGLLHRGTESEPQLSMLPLGSPEASGGLYRFEAPVPVPRLPGCPAMTTSAVTRDRSVGSCAHSGAVQPRGAGPIRGSRRADAEPPSPATDGVRLVASASDPSRALARLTRTGRLAAPIPLLRLRFRVRPPLQCQGQRCGEDMALPALRTSPSCAGTFLRHRGWIYGTSRGVPRLVHVAHRCGR